MIFFFVCFDDELVVDEEVDVFGVGDLYLCVYVLVKWVEL